MNLSYSSGPGPAPLLGETIGANLDRTTRAYPDTLALVSRHQGQRLTYAELSEAVDEIARGLLSLHIERGDRVGVWSPNCAEWAVLQYATAKVGAILVTINPAYRSDELRYALGQSGCRALVAAPSFRGADYLDMLAGVRPDLPGLERVVSLGSEGGDLRWGDLRATGASAPADPLLRRSGELQFDDPINIQYTSGTTGFPKGATLTHHNILNNGYNVTGILGLQPGDRLCIPVPLYHCFGMVMGNLGCTTRGATIVYPAEAFEPQATLEAIEAESCVGVYGVPTMFVAMVEDPDAAKRDLDSLRTGIMAGSPCPIELMKRVVTELHLPELTICYGMTETSPVSFQTRLDDPLDRRVSTVGRVHPHVEAKVVDPDTGRIVPSGQSGELCTRGYVVMRGYWDNDEATTAAIDDAGWMHTGDLATMDEDGYVNIVGRIKDMVIRGGENIYPREVEEFLLGHPAVLDVQVVGVPSERYGEELCAWVRLREGHSLDLDEVRAYCKGRIAGHKAPRYLRITDEFPMTITGKVQKFRMREISAAELGLEEQQTA